MDACAEPVEVATPIDADVEGEPIWLPATQLWTPMYRVTHAEPEPPAPKLGIGGT